MCDLPKGNFGEIGLQKLVIKSYQEDLIICVAKLVVQKSWGPLTSADLRAGSIASQHKLRSALLFGSILGPKIVRKSMKFRVSEHSISRPRFGLENYWFSRGLKTENHWFYPAKTRFCAKRSFFQQGRFLVHFRALNPPHSFSVPGVLDQPDVYFLHLIPKLILRK